MQTSLKQITMALLLSLSLFTSGGCEQFEKLKEKFEEKVDFLKGKGRFDQGPCLHLGKGLPPLCAWWPGDGGGEPPMPPEPKVEPPDGPESGDLLSSTTNFSRKVEDPETKARGTAGAAYVAPPQPGNYGGVSLQYPLEVLPGRAGVQPQLSLSYSSSGGDGIVGMGWSIGMGSIARTSRYGQLYYDSRDTFTYNGKRLVKVSGSTENENGVYRLEIESDFKRFELEGAETGGRWIVYGSDGSETHYGENLNNRIYHPDDASRVYSWQFTRTEDRNGNRMHVDYDAAAYGENRILYITEIHYTGNRQMGAKAKQVIRFHYKQRSDSYVSKAPGFTMKMDRLLDRIEVGLQGKTLWDYNLVYDISEDSGRPLLRTVNSSRTTTQPRFYYQPATHHLVWQKVYNPAAYDPALSDPSAVKYFEGDFNGDGISDMVFFNPKNGYWKAAEGRREGGYNHKIYGNRFQGYEGPQKIQWFKGNVSGDYNGDGRSDIAFYLPETREFWVAEHDGRVFQFRRYGSLYLTDLDIFRAEWFPGDFDGNGLSDSVLFDEATGEWTLMRNVGGRFEFIKFSRHFQNLFRDDYSPNFNLDSPSTSDTTPEGRARSKVHFLSGDYNGDGRTDISIYDERDGKWWVAENYIDDAIGFRLEWKLYKEFTAPEQALFGNDRFSGDFNGDGFSDFLLFDRAAGEWIIGETGDGTINFRIFSRTPEFKEITRWLQGDFNGDGRTDIGFYSVSDHNFWIGEATPNGFRYRIYNNMSYGPDPERVMQTPLPGEGVEIKKGRSLYSTGVETVDLEYVYNGNPNPGEGELAFPGCFSGDASCGDQPELLIYNRSDANLYYKKGATAPVRTGVTTPLDSPEIKIINGGRPGRFTTGARDEILYYQKSASTHHFRVISHDGGAAFSERTVAEFTSDLIYNFNIESSLYLLDDFSGEGKNSLLVLNDQAGLYYPSREPGFLLLDSTGSVRELTFDNYGSALKSADFNHLFRAGSDGDNRTIRNRFSFFSGDFTGSGSAQVLMVDRRLSDHRWYLGTINTTTNEITITLLSEVGGPLLLKLNPSNYNSNEWGAGIFHYTRTVSGGVALLYPGGSVDMRIMHELTITDTAVAQQSYTMGAGLGYRNEHDHYGNPIVWSGETPRLYDLALKRVVAIDYYSSGSEYLLRKVERPDLYTQVYPFRWIQGDYNGDGKTDIGIFHLKEPTWYFANSTGGVPDVIYKVDNGIGGSYQMEYINSTTLDNTGIDDIPDLPMNYRVCSKLTLDDGLGNRITTNYEYSNGYAFSAFINGYKETDYFGFGRFVVRDAYGGKKISEYHNVPYSDFRQNRALAGAIKMSKLIGHDNQQYTETHYNYQLHEITEGGIQSGSSYLVTPAKVEKYINSTLMETRTRDVTITAGAYELLSVTESVTDHYSDAAHPAETIASYTEYETIAATNQQRPLLEKKFSGLSSEVTTSYEYDPSGNVSKKTTNYTGVGLATVAPRIVEYQYDGFGNATSESDTSGTPARTVERSYDTQLNQFVVEQRQLTDNDIFTTTYVINYGSAFGQPDTITDPNGNTSYNGYDNYGRIISMSADTEKGVETLQSYSYSAKFPLSAKTIFYTGTSDPTVQFRTYTDGLSRDIHTVRSATDGRFVRTGRLVYDAIGRVKRKSQTDWAASTEIDNFKLNLVEKNPTKTEYDGSGRVYKVILPQAEGETTETSITTTYNDPWEVTTVHSGGKAKRTITNARGQVITVEDFGAGDDGSFITSKIGFCYDASGNRIKKSDLNNGATLSCESASSTVPPKDTSGNNIAYWSFDAFGQLRASSDPDLGVSSYTYNNFGDMTSTTDALGRTTTMSYDRLGRVTTKILPGTEGAVTYTYDLYPGITNSKGRLVVADDPVQTKYIAYDKLGRIYSETRTLKNHTTTKTDVPYTTVYKYDLMNRNSEIDYPQHPVSGVGARVCYQYNSMGYIGRIKAQADATTASSCNNGRSIIRSASYNEFGQMTASEYGNGISTTYTYDIKGRMTNIRSVLNNGVTTKTIQNASYTFAVDNNIQTVANNSDDYQTSYSYSYDGLNRLVDASGNYATTAGTTANRFHRQYAYAKNGNLLQKKFLNPDSGATMDSWNYSYSNHAATTISSTLDGAGRFNMTYDAVGNMVRQVDGKAKLTKEMEYNSYNRISRVLNSKGQEVSSYEYDDQGFRVRKLVSLGNKQEMLYPSKFFGMDVTGKINSISNIYFNGLRVASMAENGYYYYFMADQVDSVHLVIGDNGEELSRMEYLPYGETFVQEGKSDFSPKYNSQELDKETNYYYYNARHYDPQIARFVTADTVIDGDFDTQGWNRFSYVKGNPIVGKDPTGHATETLCLATGPYVIPCAVVSAVAKVFGAVLIATFAQSDTVEQIREPIESEEAQETEEVKKDLDDNSEKSQENVEPKKKTQQKKNVNRRKKKKKEHTSGKRPSTKGKHEKGQRRQRQKNLDKKRKKDNWKDFGSLSPELKALYAHFQDSHNYKIENNQKRFA